MSFKEPVFLVKTEFRLNERLADKAIEIARATVERAEERMKINQSTLDRQAAAQKAETERLKALWDKEDAVDKGARREAAAKAAAEKEARETPSPEDQARAKKIFAKRFHRWADRAWHHRLLLDEDGKPLKHVFSAYLTHPFRKMVWEHTITLPADHFASDTHWCALTIEHDLQRKWTLLLEGEARDQRRGLEHLKGQLAAWEKLRYSSDASQEATDAAHGERCVPASRESVLEQGLHSILAIQKKESGLDWEEIEEAQRIAKDTLQRAEAAGLKMGTCPACNGTKVTDPGYPDVSCPACSPLMAHRKPAPIVQDDDQGRIKMRNAEERERVLAIATRIVAGQVAKGEVDPNNEDALRAATQEAVKTAVEAYRAAVDFVFG